jgi:hypothetical protein
MVYPLLKRVVEKTVSVSKSGTRTPGLGDSQGYRLGDYKNKVSSRSRPDETDLGDTVWGSKDHIVPADGQASGDEVSIQGASKAHRDSHLGIRSQNTAKAVGGLQPSKSHGRKQGLEVGHGEIMVTSEYVVRVDE